MDLIVIEIFFCVFLELTKQRVFQIHIGFWCKENIFFIFVYICFFLILFLNRDTDNRKYNYLFGVICTLLSALAIAASQAGSLKIAVMYISVLAGCGVVVLATIFLLSDKIEMQKNKINVLNELNQKYVTERHNYAQIRRMAELDRKKYEYCEHIEDLMKSYKLIFDDMGIRFEYFMENIPLKSVDKMFFVITNLLENAKEACLKNSPEGEVFLRMYRKNDLLIIVVKNSIGQSVLTGNPLLLSDKKEENHGVGLEYVKKVIEEYNGVIDISERDRMFQVKIAVNIG
ncbi:MAG: GHKL domain-containing protein [Alistipes sp.]|nr:GHKL domain-containing protein [Alistipes sp.]